MNNQEPWEISKSQTVKMTSFFMAFLVLFSAASLSFGIYQNTKFQKQNKQIDELTETIAGKNAEIKSLIAARAMYESENKTLNDTVNALHELSGDLMSEVLGKSNVLYGTLALTTETDRRYHALDCPVLDPTKNGYAYALSEAERLGYKPCVFCRNHPPTIEEIMERMIKKREQNKTSAK